MLGANWGQWWDLTEVPGISLPFGILLLKSEIGHYMIARDMHDGEAYPLAYAYPQDLRSTVALFLAGYRVGYLLGSEDTRERVRELTEEYHAAT